MTDWLPVSEFRERGPVVLRMQLGPLTLGHLELLHELDVDLHGSWTIRELVMVSFALTQPAEKSRAALKSRWCPLVFRLLGILNRKADFGKEADKLGAWIVDQLKGPRPILDLQKQGRNSEVPTHISLMASCMSRLHVSIEDARKMPVRLAKQLVMASAEAEGQVQLFSKRDQAFLDMCKAADEAEMNAKRN